MQSLWKSTRVLVLGIVLTGLTMPSRAADLDKLAPADAEAVLVVNFKNFLESPLYKKYGEEALKQALKDPKAARIIESTGLDPTKDLSSLTLTFTGGKEDPKAAIILKGNFNVAKVQATIEKEAEKAGDKLKVTREGGQTYFTVTNPQGQDFTGTILGTDAVVMSNNKDYLKAIVAGKKAEPTAGAKTLTKTVNQLGGKETVFLAFAITQEMKDQLAKLPNAPQFKDIAPKLDSFTGAVNLTQAIDLSLALHTTDMASAKQIAQIVKGVIPLAKLAAAGNEQAKPIVDALIDNLKIGAEGTAVNATLQLTEALMKKLQPGADQ